MNKNQEDRLSMTNSLITFLKANSTITNTIAAVDPILTALIAKRMHKPRPQQAGNR